MERDYCVDFTKGILITLMVLFHLQHFVDTYPQWLYDCVYTFHMSGFMVISGYLQNNNKSVKDFFYKIRYVLSLYLIFEIFYLLSLSLLGKYLGSTVSFEFTSLKQLGYEILTHPIGCYWYLHTLFICMIIHYTTSKLVKNRMGSLLITGCLLYVVCNVFKLADFGYVLYYLLGAYISLLSLNIVKCLHPQIFSFVAFVFIAISCGEMSNYSLSGVGMTFTMLSTLFYLYRISQKKIVSVFALLGRNSISIVVFSPIFTIITKQVVPIFSFDNTAIIWTVLSLIFVLTMCLISADITDKLRISRFLFGKEFINKSIRIGEVG